MNYNSFEDTGLIKVLKFLKIHNTEYLSGQDLSDVLRISRVAVWKHIKKIQALGYTVESKQKEGYKLTKNSELLLPWEIISGLETKVFGQQAYYFDSIDSTQSQALKMVNESKNEGTIIISEKQTGGRGRSGRNWVSPKGGIWFSIILHPKFDISNITLFPIASSLALSYAIQKTCKISTELKWPNDLTIKGKKLAGMLIDASTNIPASFFPFIVTSFGHFNSGIILHVFSIAYDNANDAAIGNNVILEISNFGCNIIDIHIPPLGDIHFLPDLPFPLVCFSAIITVP